MRIEEIQQIIDRTDYWDMRILEIKSAFLGDEIYIFIENDEETSWKITFSICYKASYETDANIRKISNVSKMTNGQLGYYGQDITVNESEIKGFYNISLDFTIMVMKITCKEITVEKIPNTILN